MCRQQNNNQQSEKAPKEREKIFTMHTPDKESRSKIYEDFTRLNTKKTPKTQLKMGKEPKFLP